MDREEHLHIKKSKLVEVLSEIPYNKKMTPLQLVEEILNRAKDKGVKDFYKRFINVKAKTKTKLIRTMEAETPNATVEEFNRCLMNFRMAVKSKYSSAPIRLIQKDSPDYIMLKEVAKMAQNFVEEFDIDNKQEGYTEFLQIGYNLMGKKFFLNKYKTYQKRIFEIFRFKVDVLTDDKPEATKQMYAYWQKYMIEYAGLEELTDIERDFSKYAHLVYARNHADEVGADYEDWVVAQFEGLSFMNVVPEIYQFYGEGAVNRYERYLKDTAGVSQSADNSIVNFHKKYNNE
jgi:hypothetical protein